jgi:phosphoribosylformimino-5-aminoimidazole carboxamide ribotide isomerase
MVIPAIDIKDGRCVRLRQGEMSKETVYSARPEDMALKWYEHGAERLHLVDLNGAVEGKPVNRASIRRIAEAVPIPIQLGGGIRDMETIEAYLDLGVRYVILGTVAYKDPDFAARACREFPDRIILGIDARDGRIAVEGWTEETETSPVELARGYEGAGVCEIIYTDIQRDGMGTGPNVEGTRALAVAVGVPVIASGGISGMQDVVRIAGLSSCGVIGMITGRALYEGALDLGEAIKIAGRSNPKIGA